MSNEIQRLMNLRATIKKLNPDISDTDKESYITIATNIKCSIQPAKPEILAFVEGAMFKTYRMWCPVDTDIKENYRVVVGSDTYIVTGVNVFTIGSNPHTVAIINKIIE